MLLSEKQQRILQNISKQFPDFKELLEELKQSELKSMSQGTKENFDVFKGRVQMLTDLQQKSGS